MAETQSITNQCGSQKQISSSSSSIRVLDLVKDFEKMESPLQKEDTPRNGRTKDCSHYIEGDDDEDEDSMLCVWGSRLVRTGFSNVNCTEKILKFVSCGSESIEEVENSISVMMPDDAFQGGHVLKTNENIVDGGHFVSLYQSARVGNFCYRFDSLSARDYFVDFHFAEIVNTNGPKGMRVFDVFMQEEKVISNLDIYSVVGANRPLQLVDVRVTVGDDGVLLIRFEGINGMPIISGICINMAPPLAASQVKQECLLCEKCAAKMESNSLQSKHPRVTYMAKYEKKIEELSTQCRLKTDECYQAWMSLTALNKQLEKVSMELDNKSFQNHCLDQTMVVQAAKLRDVSSKHERDKNSWVAAINELERKIKIMKQEHSQLSHDAHECVNSIPNLHEMVSAVKGLVAECDDLKLKYSEEQVKRKAIYNQLQEVKGNIRVFCRCRPLNKEEVSAGCATVVDFDTANDGDLGILTGGSIKKVYKFDRVYTPKDDQGKNARSTELILHLQGVCLSVPVDVYMDASPMVISVLDGYNVCIFAYGQTGTGKTFTMEGTEQNRGVNYRTLEQLFRMVEERKDTHSYNISVSVLEVYNEQIRDLLATSPTLKKLEVRQASEGVHHVPGVVEAKVENVKEVWSAFQAGSNARAMGSNNVNEHSSRSHCMICIMVRAKNVINGECTMSKLWLVDLAGSERLAKTDVQGERLKEAQNINRSLSALGDVVSALAAKSSHIPYSPSEKDLGETVSSLNFATRVRGVELGPPKKQLDSGELQKLKLLLEKAKQESKSKDEALRKLEENYQSLQGKAKSKDQLCRNQQEMFSELESQLVSKTEICKQLEKQLLQLSNEVKGRDEICSTLQQKVIELEKKWKEQKHAESKTLQHKVNKLENKLKERAEEFELHLTTYQEKIKELENKLQMQGDNTSSLLHLKKLEEKLKQDHPQHQPVCLPTSCSSEKFRVTPNERKAWSTVQTPPLLSDNQRLRSLRSNNRLESQQGSSILLKGTDSLRELRRNRDIQSQGIENNFLLSGAGSSLVEKVVPTGSSKVARQIDSSKAFARVTRTTKPFSVAQRSIASNRINREQVPGVKERDHNTRLWSR
ncbi:hypothetical protein LguiA_006495 [Lonicera macranthoides]